MRVAWLMVASAIGLAGCWDLPPANVALSPGGEQVEILAEVPSEDVYEPFESVIVSALGKTPQNAGESARHLLRNRGADLNARFVSIDEASASPSWDLSGRTVVTIRGHAYRLKEDAPSYTRRR